MAKKNTKSRYTELDKIKLIGVLRKTKVECYDDLYIDTRSNYGIHDLYDALLDITYKSFSVNETDKYRQNVVNALEICAYEISGSKKEVSQDSIKRTQDLKPTYIDFCKNNSLEEDSKVIELIEDSIYDVLSRSITYSEKKESIEEVAEEEVIEEIHEITLEEALEQLVELKKKYDAQSEELDTVKKKSVTDSKKLDKRESQILQHESHIKELRNEIKELKSQKTKAENQLAKQTVAYENLSSSLSALQHSKSIVDKELIASRTKLGSLEDKVKVIDSREKEELKEKELMDQIFQIITSKDTTIEDLYRQLEKTYSRKRIRKALEQLKEEINLSYDNVKGASPIYKVSSPVIEKNKVVDCKQYRSTIDLLVISDLHIGQFSDYDARLYNKVYDYASRYGIKMILNLGDLFSYNYLSDTDTINKISYNDHILTTAAEKMPYDDGIHQYILGGNHDKNILSYGIDPIRVLESKRSDIHSLGYDDAIIKFGSDSIALHHMNKRLPENANHEFDSDEFIRVFRDYIKYNGLNRNGVFMDLFGHFHKNYINDVDSYAFVSSLTNDRIQNGAMHLKVHLNSKGNIEAIDVINLDYRNGLHQTSRKELKRRLY